MIKKLMLLALFVGGTACVTTERIDREGPSPGVTVPEKVIRYNTVAIISPELQNWRGRTTTRNGRVRLDPATERAKFSVLAIDGTNCDVTAGGTIRAWAQIRNRTSQRVQIEARTTFFNSQKGPLEPPSPWKRIFLEPNSVEMYTESSLNTVGDVGYYYIEIRKGN
jgi:hypothetical protein